MNMPEKVQIIDVGPRDGFQNISEFIPTAIKLQIIDTLVQAGFKKIQVTSFVHPRAIPQMRDSKEIAEVVIDKYKDVLFTALVPNLYGAKAAYQSGIREISVVISASESHNRENINRTINESFEEIERIRKEFEDIVIKVDVATAFGCPFEGKISMEVVGDMIERAYEIGVDDITLCDTIGIANPNQVGRILDYMINRFPDKKFGLHFHDTRGMGLANAVVALQKGYSIFETAVGGLGGCPFAPGAAGNTASEDLINMFEEMNISTGIDIDKLLETTKLIKKHIKPELTSHMANVCSA